MSLNSLSLTSRLVISNIIVIAVVFPIFALLLTGVFTSQAELNQRQTLQALSYELMAQIEVENNALAQGITMTAPAFSVPDSGLYAIIRSGNAIVWESPSALISFEKIEWKDTDTGVPLFESIEIDGHQYFNWQFKVSIEQQAQEFPFTIHIITSSDDFEQQLAAFYNLFWPWMLGLGVLFILLQILWVYWFKYPMTRLASEINEIEAGNQKQVSNDFPKEINSVTEQLNLLLKTEKLQRERYKNKLSDLAHSLKTPLAIVKTQSELPEDAIQQLDKIDRIVSHQLKKAQGSEMDWHVGCELRPIILNVVAGLEKIYSEKSIDYCVNIAEKVLFFGAEEDAYELIGNLLDNASKACTKLVQIQVKIDKHLIISIGDDGPGLTDEQTDQILKRGQRADTYAKGHGIGLSIAQDIIKSYGGTLNINGKNALGGATFVVEINFTTPQM